jgi:hypothetical protein
MPEKILETQESLLSVRHSFLRERDHDPSRSWIVYPPRNCVPNGHCPEVALSILEQVSGVVSVSFVAMLRSDYTKSSAS